MAALRLDGSQKGRFIALEGDTDIISTQLRLLPPSQKILVLPSLLESVTPDVEDHIFDARTFIRNLQTTVTQRTETARSFLQSSTATQPRLVFAVHGSVGARAACISKIATHITNGGVEEAEVIFNDIVKDGVAGLSILDKSFVDISEPPKHEGNVDETAEPIKTSKGAISEAPAANDAALADPEAGANSDSVPVGPYALKVIRKHLAMDAVRNREQLPLRTRRSLTKKEVGTHEATIDQNGDEIVTTVLTVPDRRIKLVPRPATAGFFSTLPAPPRSAGDLIPRPRKLRIDDDVPDLVSPDIASPGEESAISFPQTPVVIYGEACLVEVEPSLSATTLRKAKSVDRLYQQRRDRGLEPTLSPRPLKIMKSTSHLQKGPSGASGSSIDLTDDFLRLPRTTFVKASETTIRRSPPGSNASLSSSGSSPKIPDPATFVSRGTDAGDMQAERLADTIAVFELMEDMVIVFDSDGMCPIFNSVVQSYKNGTYPMLSLSHTATPSDSISRLALDVPHAGSLKRTSTSSLRVGVDHEVRSTSPSTAETDDPGYATGNQYDPYAADACNQVGAMRLLPRTYGKAVKGPIEPPTPPTDNTPPRSMKGEDETVQKFLPFSPLNYDNAVNVQNSFRDFLCIHFPTEENYSQYYYQPALEAERLWKPLFKIDENTKKGNVGDTVDQIVAFGSEEGVRKEFFNQTCGQIERLGTKRDGQNRSGKLDIRYLISNVMQSYYGHQPIAEDAHHPLSNPNMMAALLVPHIDAFLATNTSTRLLILQFTPAELSTVIALRNLLGSELFAIAGIVDSLASDPPPMSRQRTLSRPITPRATNPLSNEAVAARTHKQPISIGILQSQSQPNADPTTNSTTSQPSSNRKSPSISFAKANFLLPSTATDAEITTFLSAIWKLLMDKSAYYTPEPEPKPIIIEKPIAPPTPSSPPRNRDRDSGYPPSSPAGATRTSKISRLTSGGATGSTRNGYAGSIASTTRGAVQATRHMYTSSIASTKTTRTERGRREDAEWDSFKVEEDDSEDDAYDRMILGRYHARIVPEVRVVGQKRNTKKALKWLGLA